jgi:DNA-binding MarR family transcriptional regulator
VPKQSAPAAAPAAAVAAIVVTAAAEAAAAFGAAAGAVDSAAAAAFGVNRTDLRIIGLLHQAGPLSAGRLSAMAELSPAAMSTAIQRLTAAGYLTRTVDGQDRRRAVVDLTAPAADLLTAVYAPIGQAGLRELSRYSAAEITLITEFLRRGEQLQLGEADRIRSLARPAPPPRRPARAPR